MNRVNALTASLRAMRLTPQIVLAALRGITGRELWTTFLLGCALFVYHLGTMGRPGGGLLGDLIIFVGELIVVLPLLLALVVADQVTGKDPDRRGAYALAVVAGAAIGLSVTGAWHFIVFPLLIRRESFEIKLFLALFLELVMLGGAIVWVINDRRRARRARMRMHGAELERIDAEKRSIESDLQAMQARVEPQFLFNTLAQVKRLYEQDPVLAVHMLDELIAYLRAAMPKMRDTSSTLAQEIELARAYLAIVKVRLGDRLSFEIEEPGDLGSIRMPPMMLLPLIDHAIVHGLEPLTGADSIRIRIEARDGRLLLTVADSGAGFVPEASGGGIASIRERLAALYSTRARLVLRSSEMGASEAVMEIPLERVEGEEQPPAG